MSVFIIVFFTAVFVLFLGLYERKEWIKYIAVFGLLVALVVSFLPEFSFWKDYQAMYWYDENTAVFTKITLLVSILIFILGDFVLHHHQAEIYALVLFSLCGGLVLLGFQNITILFLGIELLSIPLYVLAGSRKTDAISIEASIKYFLMGAFATGFLLLGFAFIYGSSGSLDLVNIAIFSQTQKGDSMFVLGVLLVLVAMAFKVAMVPFHIWSPDVYFGSPSWITLFMASVVKIVGFYTFFKLMTIAFVGVQEVWLPVLWGLVCATLVLASILGMVQDDAKKMLAYSSIVNVGYVSLVFFGIDEASVQRLAFYLLAYSISTIGVFMGLIWVEKREKYTGFEAFDGLAKSQPLLALGMLVSLFSMAGIPFSGGFVGKMNLFLQAMEQASVLIIISVLASVVSVVYYLRLIIALYLRKSEEKNIPQKLSFSYQLSIIFILLITLLMGVFPNILFKFL